MTLLTLYRKELVAYFVSPLFYVVSAVFLCLSGYYFYTDLIFFVTFGFGVNILGNFWQLLLVDLRLVMLLSIPLLTMRAFAEEKKLGTIELLLTYPIRDSELLLAKFAACATVCTAMLAGTLCYPVYVHALQPFPWVPLLAGYLGLLLLALSFVACGVFVSSLTESQVIAAAVTIGMLLFFWIVSWNEAATSPALLRVLIRVSMFDHFESFSRGVIVASDAAFFVCFIAFFNFLTLRVLESRTWRGHR
ncbi:MAG: ABC-type transport system involved in multi-copper enzyme maturation, permease component [Deltaproteobacteria bacterium]|nr:ABC-type transport system involved in multi-copper enzyme maturation, permease component [Deltaproteobacteria bacterium]